MAIGVRLSVMIFTLVSDISKHLLGPDSTSPEADIRRSPSALTTTFSDPAPRSFIVSPSGAPRGAVSAEKRKRRRWTAARRLAHMAYEIRKIMLDARRSFQQVSSAKYANYFSIGIIVKFRGIAALALTEKRDRFKIPQEISKAATLVNFRNSNLS